MDQHQMPHNVDGYQNLYGDSFGNLFPSGNEQGFDASNWNFGGSESHNLTPSSEQPASLYTNWQQPPATDPALLNGYGHNITKSPSVQFPPYGIPRQYQQSPIDPSLVQSSSGLNSPFHLNQPQYGRQQMEGVTIAPQALEHETIRVAQNANPVSQYQDIRNTYTPTSQYQRSFTPSAPLADQKALLSAMPQSQLSGRFTVIDFEALKATTNSNRMHNFINVGQQDYEFPINKAALPTPVPRKSRNELRKLAKNDPKLLAKLGKRPSKKAHHVTSASAKLQRPQSLPKALHHGSTINVETESSSEEDSSEDSSDEYSEDELSESSPLPPRRPDDLREAVKYDTIKALWRSRRIGTSSDSIKEGLKEFWEVVKTIRDRWKTDAAAVQEAEEKKKLGELPLLRSRVKDQRDMIEIALKAAVDHGHISIVELLSENKAFLYLCYQFLLDRWKQKDFDGALVRLVLQILAVCTTLNEDNFKATQLVKVVPRFATKGSPETQALVKRIEAAVEAGTKKAAQKQEKSGDTKSVESDVKSPVSSHPTPEPVAGIKRAAPMGAANGQPPKRVASSAPTPASTGAAAASKPVTAGIKRPAPGASTSKTSATAALVTPAAKPKQVVAKPSGFFSAPQTTVKKPATTVVTKPSMPAAAASVAKPTVEKKAAVPLVATAKPSFSFADTMANLTKTKEKPASPKPEKEGENKTQETPEEKAKRIRKEARRKLRVSFKPEHSLVEVRFFTHDPDEELGHDASMTRDVGDVGGEGRMFKQHMDVDLDDDDDGSGEETLMTYNSPSVIDFSDVDKGERERNYAPYGGGMCEPESPEKKAREEYEASTLIVVYTDPSDIPPCPKEPADPYNGEANTTKSFGIVEGVAATRAAQLAGNSTQPQQPQQGQPPAAGGVDINYLLAMLNPAQQQAQQPPAQQPAQLPAAVPAQAPAIDLQAILASLNPSAAPATQAAPANTQPANPLASLMANLQGTCTPQQASQPPPPMPNAAFDPAGLAAVMAQFGQGQTQVPPPMPGMPPYGFPGMPFMPPQTMQQFQQSQYPFENEERRRWREQQGDGEGFDDQGQNKKKKSFKDKRFTQPCKYFKLGKCQKGDQCTYLHT